MQLNLGENLKKPPATPKHKNFWKKTLEAVYIHINEHFEKGQYFFSTKYNFVNRATVVPSVQIIFKMFTQSETSSSSSKLEVPLGQIIFKMYTQSETIPLVTLVNENDVTKSQ